MVLCGNCLDRPGRVEAWSARFERTGPAVLIGQRPNRHMRDDRAA
jgi:hypothetical protein